MPLLAGVMTVCYPGGKCGISVSKEDPRISSQVQLSESQMQQLKDLARRRGVPVAALIREGADLVTRSSGTVDEGHRRRRAMAAAGRFHSGHKDFAGAHDRHLAEVLRE